jgi:hypothetical protein
MTQPRKSVVVARRLLASVVLTPAIAGVYALIYTLLVAYGAEPAHTALGVALNGLWLGAVASLAFALAPLVWKRN